MEIDPSKLTYPQEFTLLSEKKFLHAYEFLHDLKEQFNATGKDQEIGKIFQEAEGRLGEAKLNLKTEIDKVTNANEALLKEDRKKLTTALKNMQKEVIKVLQEARIDAIGKLSTKNVEDGKKSEMERDVKILASGGLGAKQKLRKWFFIPKATAVLYHNTIRDLNNANIEKFKESLQQKETYKELSEELSGEMSKELLSRMDGVIHTTGNTSADKVQTATAKTLILAEPLKTEKQLKSYMAQRLSHKERKPIEKKIIIDNKNTDVKSIYVPLNVSFHERLEGLGKYFSNIFSTMGLSTAQRTGKHLINGWLSELTFQGKSVYTAFRHGILSHKYGKTDLERKEFAMQMAKDLLTGVVLEKLNKLNISLEEASKKESLSIFLSSVSLVTPDDFRAFFEGNTSEKTMLQDQVDALYSLQKEIQETGRFEIDGKKIPINLKVFAFNYGVNAGAVGKLGWAPGLKLGLDFQNEMNQKSLEDLNKYYKDNLIDNPFSWFWKSQKTVTEMQTALKTYFGKEETLNRYESLQPQMEEFNRLTNDMKSLMEDINKLNEHKDSYLEGGNQYEVGAKIIVLMNTLERMGTLAKAIGVEGVDDGFAAAFNCMSGKDRSGLMDAMAKAMTTMQEEDGKIPTHTELVENKEFRDRFKELLIKYLLEGGGLEITEINTDASGYKVGPEAMIYDMLPEIFQDIQGMSSTTQA